MARLFCKELDHTHKKHRIKTKAAAAKQAPLVFALLAPHSPSNLVKAGLF